jgi:hypothetical protein
MSGLKTGPTEEWPSGDMGTGTEADLSATLRSGRDDNVVAKRPVKQIPFGDDKQEKQEQQERQQQRTMQATRAF